MDALTHTPILSRLRAMAADIKLSHSIFALPFALLGGVMAAWHPDPPMPGSTGGRLCLIVLAMICARTSAMLANRLLDQEIDARNPRTRSRALPSGRIRRSDAVGAWMVSSAGFVLIAAAFGIWFDNWWPARLSVPVLLWLSAYGLLKRWTSLCHLYLGVSLAMSPPAAALAMYPEALTQPSIWLLAMMVIGWVAGFDIIYALQDRETDRDQGLYSMPARLGTARALLISRLLHGASAVALIGVWQLDDRLGSIFGTAVLATVALLIAEQVSVHRWGTTRMALTFFTMNGIVSCLIGAAGITDLVRAGLSQAG